MENMNVCEPVLAKKLEDYTFEKNDFIAAGEITVTITLSEYRRLVTSDATKTADIEKANKDRFERDNENRRLKEEVARLKAELYELKVSVDAKEEK